MRLRLCLLGPLGAPFVALACGQTNFGQGGPSGTDGGVDVTAPAPSPEAGAVADPAFCTTSIADYCKAHPCPDLDQAASPSSPFCGRKVISTSTCGGFAAVAVGGSDSTTMYFYDPNTRALVGVQYSLALQNAPVCLAGPLSTSLPVSCSGPWNNDVGCLCPPDPGPTAWPLPITMHAPSAACTSEQIDAFYACVVNHAQTPSCARFLDGGAADLGCSECLVPSSGVERGALVGGFVRVPNTAGCIADATGDSSDAGCASRYAAAEGCAVSACSQQCAFSDDTASGQCLNGALAGTCKGLADLASCASVDAGFAESCGIGAPLSVQYQKIATRLCGMPDAGTPDAGTVGDAGGD